MKTAAVPAAHWRLLRTGYHPKSSSLPTTSASAAPCDGTVLQGFESPVIVPNSHAVDAVSCRHML